MINVRTNARLNQFSQLAIYPEPGDLVKNEQGIIELYLGYEEIYDLDDDYDDDVVTFNYKHMILLDGKLSTIFRFASYYHGTIVAKFEDSL